jgi:hypothetical protein
MLLWGMISAMENLPDLESEGLVAVTEPETVIVEKHARRKTGRKPLPDIFPREEIIHDIPEEEKVCACGCRKPYAMNFSKLKDVVC